MPLISFLFTRNLNQLHESKSKALARNCHRHSISPIYTLPISELGLLLDLFPSSGFVSKLDRSGLTQESLELDVLASPPTGPPTVIGANSWLVSCDGKTYKFNKYGIKRKDGIIPVYAMQAHGGTEVKKVWQKGTRICKIYLLKNYTIQCSRVFLVDANDQDTRLPMVLVGMGGILPGQPGCLPPKQHNLCSLSNRKQFPVRHGADW
jgi:hypothetical protein